MAGDVGTIAPRFANSTWMGAFIMPRNTQVIARIVLLASLVFSTTWSLASDPPAQPKSFRNPFFAFCFDQYDAKNRTLQQQADMVKQLGFDGVGHVGLDDLEQRLKSLDAVGLQLYLAGTTVNPVQPATSYLPEIQMVLPLLKNRPTVLYLILDGLPANDQAAVDALRRIADEANKWNVRVAIYPHTGNWVCRVDHAVRLAKLVKRPNFGVIFNLCHWLKNEGPEHLRETLRDALPYLFVVTINGADRAGKSDRGWKRLIQPLDRGTYDVPSLVQTLHELGYRGPIGLMCWAITGDAREHLQRSINTWQRWRAR